MLSQKTENECRSDRGIEPRSGPGYYNNHNVLRYQYQLENKVHTMFGSLEMALEDQLYSKDKAEKSTETKNRVTQDKTDTRDIECN